MSAVIHKIEHEFFVNAFRLVDSVEGTGKGMLLSK